MAPSHEPVDGGSGRDEGNDGCGQRYDRKGQELMQMDGGDEAEGPEGRVAIWSGSRRKVQVSRESSASGWQDKVPCRLWGRGQLEGGYSCQEAGKH